jgi:DNA polymerase-3 subunit alpha
MPPPPDNFPDGWDEEWQPSFDDASIAARPEPVGQLANLTYEQHTPTESIPAESTPGPVNAAATVQPIAPETIQFPSLYIPLAKEEKDKDHPPRQITVLLRPTGDKERDKRRIKTLHGILTSYHGRDKFSFHIFENGKGHLIDFPNDTTRLCADLLSRLKRLMGEENWRVEEITFQ